MKTLEELSHDSFYNMDKYSQITIDFIQEVEDLLNPDNYGKDNKVRTSKLESISYKISTVLDVLNPELKTDKEALLNLIEIIENV